jgi:glycosyltransferase involved in cell wall biosynthesis
MISIVIPCYNCELFVSRAIQSVLKQEDVDWELILVNNNSCDKTQEVLSYYESRYPSKVTSVMELKPGGAAARNAGLRLSQGEWIQFLDADDEILPNKLSMQSKIALNQGCDVIAGAYYFNDGSREPSVRTPFSQDIWKALVSSNLGITTANLWRKECLNNVGGWDENLSSSQEYDLLFRLLSKDVKIGYDLEPRSIIYSRGDSVSKSFDGKRVEEILENLVNLRLRIREHLSDRDLLTKDLKKFISLFLYNHLMQKKIVVPEYVSKKLKEMDLDIPLVVKLKSELKYNLKRLFRRAK